MFEMNRTRRRFIRLINMQFGNAVAIHQLILVRFPMAPLVIRKSFRKVTTVLCNH